MKKVTLILVLLFFTVSWQISAQITSYPYSEDFESGDGGWVADNTTNGSWELGTPAGATINSADSGTNAWMTSLAADYNTNEDSWVSSPVFDLSSLAAPSIELSVWWNSEFSWDGFVLQSSIDSGASWQNVGAVGDPNNWYTDGTINGNPGGQQEGWTGRDAANGSQGWVIARHALIGLGGQSNVLLRLAFGSDGSVQDDGVAFDTVGIFDVLCPEPSGVIVDTITDTSANVSWTPGNAEASWEIVVQAAGTGVPAGAGTTTSSNAPYNATTLTPSTAYEVYVRADCVADGFSNWVGPVNFSTLNVPPPPPVGVTCASGSSSFIFTEDFETDPAAGWTGTGFSGDNGNWDITAGNANSGGTGPNASFSGGMHLEYEASGNSSDIASAISPAIDLTAAVDGAELSFYMHAFGADMGALNVGISTSAAGPFTNLYSWIGDYQTTDAEAWVPIGINLDAYLGQVVYIEFSYGGAGTGFEGDMSIDFFRVESCGTFCIAPSGINITNITDISADIDWTANSGEVAWEIVVVPAGTGEPAGAGTPTPSNNPYNATGLTASTAYEIWVRADCGAGVFSVWSGPVNFTTLNTPPPPPVGVTCTTGSSSFIFTEDFETDPPAGWTGTGFSGDNGNWDITAGNANSFGTGPNASFSGGMHLEYEASGNAVDIASAISPAIDLSTAVDGAELSFYMHSFGADMGTLNVGISTSVAGPFTNLYTWIGDYQTTDAEAWVPIGINLDAYLGQVVYVEFSYGGAGTGFEGDMSIDFFRVEACGDFCIAPSGLTVSNITGTTADIDWTPNSGELAWEYVVVPAGTGAPTGAGTASGSTSVNETGLSFSTDYEVWVRADCGAGAFSVWAGPVNFTTTIQTVFNVDCTAGPINSFYCYENNDTSVITYTSSDGSPLNLTINSGEVEGAPWDFLVVLDSDGVTELYNGEGNDGDISGLTFQSTGDTIFFSITSDGSVSCASGSFCCSAGIDYTVACATCINPAATYVVVDDCANGPQFLIDVNVTSIGDATSLTITNSFDATTVPVTAVGTYQIGPFPFVTPIVVTISNDQDVNCVINSQPIELLACPPDNDNPCNATVASVNTDGSCTLVTPGTLIEATDSGVAVGSCGGNPDDDVWFEFVAQSDVQLISIINIAGGTFNIDHGVYEGTCGALTELYCSNADASVTPQLTVGNTYYVRVFSGGGVSETSTFDLCIKDAPTNIICENAINFCSDGTGSLTSPNIIGIPNTGQIACLFTAPNPTWNILQIGDSGLIEIQIDQTDDSGNGLDVDFVLWGPFASLDGACGNLDTGCPTPGDCPNNTTNPNFYPSGNIVDCSYSAAATENLTIDNAIAGEIYILLVTNFNGGAGNITIGQTNAGGGTITAEIEAEITSNEVVFIDDDNDPATPDVAAVCGFDSVTIEADSPFADSYIWYKDGFAITGETSSTLTITESDTYQVQAFDDECNDDAFSQIVSIKLYKDPGAIADLSLTLCDGPSGDGIEDFDLDALAATIGLTADFVVTYYATQNDANQAINPLSSPYSSAGETIYFRIEDVDAANDNFLGCRQLAQAVLVVDPLPDANQPQDLVVCDDDADGSTDFDLSLQDDDINNQPNIVITYHTSAADAEAGTGALSSPHTSSGETIHVRVEDTITGCYNTTSFDIVVDVVPQAAFVSDFDYEVCPNATVPITISIVPTNFTASEVTIEWYLDNGLIAGESGLTLAVLLQGDYTAEITFNASQCFFAVTQNVIELESCVIPQGISPNGDGMNDTFDLSSYDVSKLEVFNRNGTLVYEKKNYTNEWHGQDKDGDELPVGTYFYTMEYENGKQRSAWVYIQRLN